MKETQTQKAVRFGNDYQMRVGMEPLKDIAERVLADIKINYAEHEKKVLAMEAEKAKTK